MLSSHKLYAMIERIMRWPTFKGGRAAVAISSGNYTFNLDTATVFDASVTASGTATFVALDPTKVYTFQVNAVTTGAYNFTNLIMSGVTVYKPTGTTFQLAGTGRTTIGFTYDGPAATLDYYLVQMAAYP